MKTKLTDLSIQKLPEGLFIDEKLSAFGIRIGKLRKTWLVIKGAGRIQIRLGHYPAMTLAEARKRALVTLGSPMPTKTVLGFQDAVQSFLELPRWRPQSRRVLTSNLSKFKWKGPLTSITHEDIALALEAIPTRSARAHALKDIRTFFNWCVPRYLPSSPCHGLKMDAQPSRDRVLTNDELRRVWNACDGTFGTIVKLLILTGQRKTEIGSLTWEQVTPEIITIPASVAKNGREHTFPATSTVLALLHSGTPSTGAIFRSSKDPLQSYNGYTFHLRQLHASSGTSNWTLHDLRRTFVSNMASLGVAPHIISALINHVSEGLSPIQRVYNRYNYQAEMRDAVLKYEAFIKELVNV